MFHEYGGPVNNIMSTVNRRCCQPALTASIVVTSAAGPPLARTSRERRRSAGATFPIRFWSWRRIARTEVLLPWTEPCHQISRVAAERPRKRQNVEQCDVALAALHAADVRPMETCGVREGLLRETERLPPRPDPVAEHGKCRVSGLVGHPVQATGMMHLSRQNPSSTEAPLGATSGHC